MFRLDQANNTISRIKKQSFSELSYSERDHLQEWIAGEPECLGEDLLIIQKEFDGFDDTRERLDLLAIDKDGQLVVIENKLDDSGRDVVWQALKYASYCSALTRVRIIEIFRSYLETSGRGEDPETLIAQFLDADDLSDVELNRGSEQRIILIAANFRREVTSTVLWLLNNQIDIRCIRATPYKLEGEVLLNFEQIIPVPETADYMIGISEKTAEAKALSSSDQIRYNRRKEFWGHCLARFQRSDLGLFNKINPSRDHWLSAGSGVRSCPYQMIFGQKIARVQLKIERSDKVENKALFDGLEARKEEIEASFEHPLVWRRLDGAKSSSIEFGRDFDGYDEEKWPEIIEWLHENMAALHAAFHEPLAEEATRLFN